MTKRLLLSLLAVAVLLSSGCLFWRKSHKPKESGAIATEVEQEFRQRWTARRISELAQQGVTGPAAQAQASQEFDQKYPYAIPSKKK
ncbi:MAG TPA: hypothetical protein VHE61_03100 [Opitutaceae bacterium]|nr:hypothetical protein [Opitutaceae bacterium]